MSTPRNGNVVCVFIVSQTFPFSLQVIPQNKTKETEMENTDKNQEQKNPLLTSKDFINPNLLIEWCKQGFIGGSEAVRLYITASVISHTRDGKDYFEKAVNIARKLNVSPALVRQTIQRQDKITRAGRNGQRGRRNWVLKGINDKRETKQF